MIISVHDKTTVVTTSNHMNIMDQIAPGKDYLFLLYYITSLAYLCYRYIYICMYILCVFVLSMKIRLQVQYNIPHKDMPFLGGE